MNDVLCKTPSVQSVDSNLSADYVSAMVYGQEDIEPDQLRATALREQECETRIKADLKIQAETEKVRHQMR